MKKNIPLQVLETIEPFLEQKGSGFEAADPNGLLLKFVDKDNKYDFYFNIEEYTTEKDFELLIDYKPADKRTVLNRRLWIKADQLESFFKVWLNLLEGYEKVKTPFDDPIIEAYAEEYFAEFDIIEEEAEIKPLTTKQILLLDEHLDNIQKIIEGYQTNENEPEIQQIRNDISELRNNLTKKSKKWVAEKLSKIWAKMTKQGPKLLKEFLSEARKHVIKEGVKSLFSEGMNLIN